MLLPAIHTAAFAFYAMDFQSYDNSNGVVANEKDSSYAYSGVILLFSLGNLGIGVCLALLTRALVNRRSLWYWSCSITSLIIVAIESQVILHRGNFDWYPIIETLIFNTIGFIGFALGLTIGFSIMYPLLRKIPEIERLI